MDNILDPLNDKQREAVLYTEGALLVLAGAGSGKTRVITHRFAYLLREKKLYLNNILAVTFTNKAAGEMKERIGGLVGIDTRNAWVRTFHSTGVLIIRKNPEAIGFPKDFVIYDDTDSKNLVKTIMKELGINTDSFNPSGIAEKISSLKDSLISPDEFDKTKVYEYDNVVSQVYYRYESVLRKNRALDFPDLIGQPIKIFTERKDILEYYQNLWSYVMVDEFQDTNSAQYKLINLICEKNENVCVVGDDDQSIYGWRGANVDNIFDFQTKYNAKVIPLEQNYRSTSTILSAANSIVAKIPGRMEKKLWTERKSDDKIQIIEAFTDKEEAQIIVETADHLLSDYDYRDFAVFYRTNAQSRLFEETLLSHNIPYKIFGGQKFYERKEIKDILSYIKIIVNPFDSASFDRIINVPKRKIGDVTQEKIKRIASDKNISFIEALSSKDFYRSSGTLVQKNSLKIIRELGQILRELEESKDRITPTNFVKILLEAVDYKNYILIFDDDGLDRWSNVEELINSVKDFENANPDTYIADFLSEVTLQSSIDNFDDDKDRNYVSLMTMHNAKGLEFPVVFISGAVSGLIPHSQSFDSERGMNEERRLFYVAITRAKNRLFISYPDTRLKFGEVTNCTPSPFLKDIPQELVDNPYLQRRKNLNKETASQGFKASGKHGYAGNKEKKDYPAENEEPRFDINEKASTIKDISELNVGDIIRHRIFGRGRVTFVSDKFIKVNFDKYGVQNMSGNFLSNVAVIRQ
jgi:DNA helicase II / ATP-dependent DNA helicase PcrA